MNKIKIDIHDTWFQLMVIETNGHVWSGPTWNYDTYFTKELVEELSKKVESTVPTSSSIGLDLDAVEKMQILAAKIATGRF